MRIYGLKNCDTCRKALKSLAEVGHDVVFVDVRADGISTDDLARFHQAFGDQLLNTRSTTWRGLDEQDRARNPLELIAEHPALMKRPIVEDGNRLTLGWDKATAASWLQAIVT